MPTSIRSRLLLLVLLVLLPALAALAFVITRAYEIEREALERNLGDGSRALSMVVDRELTHRTAIARVLAASRYLDGTGPIAPSQLQSFDQQARLALQGLSGWVELRAPGQVLLDTRLPDGTPPRAREGPLDEREAVGTLDGSGESLHATVVQPVRRNGRTLYNVAVTILPAELQQIVDRQALPPGWVGAVLDQRGRMVARHPGGARYAGRETTAELQGHLAAGREGLFHALSLDGDAMTGYFSTSPQGWSYVTAMPRSALAGGVPKAVTALTLTALALLGLAVAGALWVARGIVRPVNSLRESAARLQAGHAVPRQRTGIVECDAVADALTDAAHETQQRRAELERQVAAAVAQARRGEQQASHSQRVEALGRLTGGVAHDFNNLLGVISNSAHVMQRRSDSPELAGPLAAVLRAVEVGSRLTQHLLRFSGRHPTRPSRVELAHYLPDLQELLQLVLGKRIQVSLTVAAGTRSIHVDYSELELALINLALNARDALPRGGRVWFDARNAPAEETAGLPPGEYVVVTVADDGSGIDEAIVDRVFEPFFTTKVAQQGTGLGLSQVLGFCTQAGGTARLASTRGMGTTVSLLIPAAAATSGVPATPEAGPALPDLQGRRVLLVEDNEELAGVTVALLEAFGCVVEEARSPAEALRRLETGARFDVVLSDVVMPGGIDGIGLAERLRESRPELPVVLITGYSSALSGARGFIVLRKPCTPEELTATIARAIAERAALAQP